MNCLSVLEGTFSPPSASLSISRKGDFLLVLKADIDPGGGGGRVTWVNFCWVCAAGLSESLHYYSLFCGQL